MKRRRYIKLMVVLLMFLAILFYYIFNYKYSGGVHGRNVTLILQFTGVKKTEVIPTKRENRNPFLCPSDISYKSWPTTRMTMPETLPFGTLSTERYFQAALNNLQHCDLPDQLKNLSCLRCIVIGNGGVLRNRTLGKKINSYDVVIRLNNGPVIGYENDVGNKTTFRFCYPESIFNDHSQHDANTTMVFVPFKAVDLRWLKEVLLKKKVSLRGFWKKPPMELTYKNTQIRILNPSVVQKAAFKLLNLPKVVPGPKPPQYPTTGIIAISMALTMCDEVHIAGFKYDNKNPNSTLHYYGNETMSAMRKWLKRDQIPWEQTSTWTTEIEAPLSKASPFQNLPSLDIYKNLHPPPSIGNENATNMLYHNVTAEQKLLNELKSSNRIFDLTGNF